MNDSPLKPASSRRKKMDKTMMAIYFLILFIVAGAALLVFLLDICAFLLTIASVNLLIRRTTPALILPSLLPAP